MMRLLLWLTCFCVLGWTSVAVAAEKVPVVTQEPKLLSTVQLRHPHPGSQKPLTLTLRIRLNAEGQVQQAVLQNSSGDAAFDHKLEAEAKGWRFSPGQRHGKPVAMIVQLPVTFQP
ncbi:MAG: energy transducer TonB [Neisseriaceae bacterium]|nr:energy transducer TonB [Neisseriaceae bacterium]MBP6862187.1 energy transducer TonB [Neisseriaceae bacterium]